MRNLRTLIWTLFIIACIGVGIISSLSLVDVEVEGFGWIRASSCLVGGQSNDVVEGFRVISAE